MVRIAIFNTVCANVVWTKPILFVPNAIDRVLVLLELKIPVVKSKPFSTSAPLVNVVVPVAINASASPNVIVPVVLTVNAAMVLVLLVMVPVPSMVGVKLVNVPVVDSVKSPVIFKLVAVAFIDADPKLRFLYHEPDVNAARLAPVVNVKFIALAIEPPAVDPKLNVLVLLISATVNPPGPVYVNPVIVFMASTMVAAVVCVRLMLLALALPNATDLVLLLFELNIPVFKVTPSTSVSVPAVSV